MNVVSIRALQSDLGLICILFTFVFLMVER